MNSDYPGLIGIHSNNQGFFAFRTSNGVDLGYMFYDIDPYANQLDWFNIIIQHQKINETTIRRKAYVNGILSNQQDTTNIKLDYLLDIYIGGRDSNRNWNGQIQDVRIYNYAISEQKIKELAQPKILHYKFDDRSEEATYNMQETVSDRF